MLYTGHGGTRAYVIDCRPVVFRTYFTVRLFARAYSITTMRRRRTLTVKYNYTSCTLVRSPESVSPCSYVHDSVDGVCACVLDDGDHVRRDIYKNRAKRGRRIVVITVSVHFCIFTTASRVGAITMKRGKLLCDVDGYNCLTRSYTRGVAI